MILSARMKRIFVTGAAGFIGYHLCERLLNRGDEVIGIDNLNDYYDVSLKKARLSKLENQKNFHFEKIDLCDRDALLSLFASKKPNRVVNLAAQAGVRYSLTNPYVYTNSNITGFIHVLEGCRHNGVEHLVYASSSSVYGSNRKLPFAVGDTVDHPVSLYAATKKANELMAHTYSHLYQLPTTGLRFFTVYGPWGRPDMALFLFTKNILEGKQIEVFNYGDHRRDFTFIGDIIEGVIRVLDKVAEPDPKWDPLKPNCATSSAPYRIFNIGNNNPVWLKDFIAAIEEATGKQAIQKMMPMQMGDVLETYADVDSLSEYIGFKPATPIREGIKKFVDWYKSYYRA